MAINQRGYGRQSSKYFSLGLLLVNSSDVINFGACASNDGKKSEDGSVRIEMRGSSNASFPRGVQRTEYLLISVFQSAVDIYDSYWERYKNWLQFLSNDE